MSLLDKLRVKNKSYIRDLCNPKEQRLLDRATTIDRIDRILGPLESLMQLYGDPLLQGVGVAFEVGEALLLKAPFVIKYLRMTKDYDALVSWAPKEIFAIMVPFGDFIDITHAYERQTVLYFEREAKRKRI